MHGMLQMVRIVLSLFALALLQLTGSEPGVFGSAVRVFSPPICEQLILRPLRRGSIVSYRWKAESKQYARCHILQRV